MVKDNKVFIKCSLCEYQFERKLIGKLLEGVMEFICVTCKLDMRLTKLEESVRKLECCDKELGVVKEGLSEVRAVLEEQSQVRHQYSDAVKKQGDLHNVDSDDEFADCSQVLLVDLPSEKEKAKEIVRHRAESGNDDVILVIGNSLVRNVSDSGGHTKIVFFSGGDIFDVEKAISFDLPEKLIVHVSADELIKFMNRSEELVSKIHGYLRR